MVKAIYHVHHIIPRHAGGTDDPSNLIRITVAEHADAHKKLWEEHGRLQDKMAWLMLSGKTEEAEQARIAITKTPEFRQKISKAMTGKVRTDEHRANLSKALTGKKLSDTTKDKIRHAHIGNSTSWNNQTPEQKSIWKAKIAEGRRRRWDTTSIEERRLLSVKMNAAKASQRQI